MTFSGLVARVAASVSVVVAVVVAVPAAADAASAFDGAWTVSETCPPTAQDVRGHAWTYPALVRDGALSARYQASNEGGGSIALQGRIGADGHAMLNAAGKVGHAEYAVGHVGHGTPYRFHVEARFDGSGGSGRRLEQRACEFSFTRG